MFRVFGPTNQSADMTCAQKLLKFDRSLGTLAQNYSMQVLRSLNANCSIDVH